ncbi:MAG: response regulator transcription factor [Elusimicrobia bacterium]|nr:response regulator transcription factor [Elusimicrobiota bacterium]
MRCKILVIDDEPETLAVTRAVLEKAGYCAITARCAAEGIDRAIESAPDLILSDVSMPDMDGLALCRRLKTETRLSRVPVVLVSAMRKEEVDQIEGLDLGADDYLAKPVSAVMLLAKVRSVLRRSAGPRHVQETLRGSGIELDLDARSVKERGRQVSLTRKEFDLLTTFLRKPRRVLSIPYLLETVWGYDPAVYNDPHTVEVHASSLRKKLRKTLAGKIVSIPGLGYRFDP